MSLIENKLYLEDIDYVSSLNLEWNNLKNASVLISGATGMIGSFLVDVLMQKNIKESFNCNIYILGRNREKAVKRFNDYFNNKLFNFIECNLNDTNLKIDIPKSDYIFHLASNTHPRAYATDPIGTVTANIIGLKNLLDIAVEKNCKRFIFASSVEVYGENRGDINEFDENYCGYIDCNTLRAGYPESKRCGEALCHAYIKQKNLDIVIPRIARTYGPTMLKSDSKAISQFIKNALNHENIVLKSEGNQLYSYTYVADCVSGLLYCLFKGKCGEAYNIADEKSNIKLKDLASLIADYSGTKVIFELPDEVEKSGYSKATKAIMNGDKIKNLGWKAKYDIKNGIERDLKVLIYR